MKSTHKPPTLLGLLNAGEREKFLRLCTVREYKKGDEVVREMEDDENMYFIAAGKVRVTLFSKDGREVSFTHLSSGDNFGELAIIDGKPRSANVIALDDTEMIIMPPKVFRKMYLKHPKVAIDLLQQFSGMIRRLCDRIFEYSTTDVTHRIHAELLRIAHAHTDLDGIARIIKMPTQSEFASRVSCNREAISRELSVLENDGILQKKNSGVVIERLDDLQAMVDLAKGRNEMSGEMSAQEC